MEWIPDDPIVSCMIRTGYPYWMEDDYYSEDDAEDDDDEKDLEVEEEE